MLLQRTMMILRKVHKQKTRHIGGAMLPGIDSSTFTPSFGEMCQIWVVIQASVADAILNRWQGAEVVNQRVAIVGRQVPYAFNYRVHRPGGVLTVR